MATKKKIETFKQIDLRAIVYREGTWWVAHCLELDIASEGGTNFVAADLLCSLLRFYFDNSECFVDIIRPAPAEIWERYWRGAWMTAIPFKTKFGMVHLDVKWTLNGNQEED